jgi:pimeloyl-ACP methyl ester carboxylesterase
MLRTLLAAGLLACSLVASAQEAFKVSVVGKGKPMILIPGLSCTGEVWNETVNRYKDHYECHVLTLSGFGDSKGIGDPFLPKVRDGVIAYAKSKKLDKPVLVGHSLGATVVLWVAATEPKLASSVIAVDGVPWIGGLTPGVTVESATKMGEQIRTSIGSSTQAAFAEQTKMFLGQMITDPKRVEEVVKTGGKSDPKAVGQAMYEMFANDLRPLMSKIEAPVLLLASGGMAPTAESKAQVEKAFRDQVKDIKDLKFAINPAARHFVFFDDPKWFFDQIDGFLAGK